MPDRVSTALSERSERRLVTIPALATHTTVPTVALTFRPCPKRSRNVCPTARMVCVLCVSVCVCPLCVALAPACGPRCVAPRPDFLIGRARARSLPVRNCDRFPRARFPQA